MKSKEPKQPLFSEMERCEHCGNRAPMQIVAKHSHVRSVYDEQTGESRKEGNVYEMLECPACREIQLRNYFWSDFLEPHEVQYKLLYPGSNKIPCGLPQKIKKAYEAALRVKGIDANACGVLMGRVLELVCEDRNANGRFLGNKLDDLAKKGEIPVKLVAVANGLKDLRNVGAHASLGELTGNETPILADLCRAILEYVYSAPHLANQAEMSLKRLKNPKGDRRKDMHV